MTVKEGTKFGHYEILSLLGAGGMGEAYRARDLRLDREVAVKLLPAELAGGEDRLRRFELEARATSALNHPNTLTIQEIDVWAREARPAAGAGAVCGLIAVRNQLGENHPESTKSAEEPVAIGVIGHCACGLCKGVCVRITDPLRNTKGLCALCQSTRFLSSLSTEAGAFTDSSTKPRAGGV